MSDIAGLYDKLAGHYHLYYPDFSAACDKQGADLARLLRAEAGGDPGRVLDCACGVGTQAIGLKRQGIDVIASDISPASAARTAELSARLGAPLPTATADMRRLEAVFSQRFGAIIACGNALGHMKDGELAEALASVRARLVPGGLFLAAVSDYRGGQRPLVGDHAVIEHPGVQLAYIQARRWSADWRSYVCDDYTILRREGEKPEMIHVSAEFQARLPDELIAAFQAAGFAGVRCVEPAESGHHNPIILGRA